MSGEKHVSLNNTFALNQVMHATCRSMQHIVIRKRFEDLQAAVEAAATDDEIAKLARVAYQASACPHHKPVKASHAHVTSRHMT